MTKSLAFIYSTFNNINNNNYYYYYYINHNIINNKNGGGGDDDDDLLTLSARIYAIILNSTFTIMEHMTHMYIKICVKTNMNITYKIYQMR